jgi:hypothetical protein
MPLLLKKVIFSIPIVVLLSGCGNNLQNRVAERITQECGNKPMPNCKIELRTVTEFKWDKMYIFGSWTTSDSISKTIGFKYSGDDIGDDTQIILFTNGKQIVYQEDIDYLNGSKKILFDDENDSLFLSKKYYSPSEAIFRVNLDTTAEFAKFYLIRIKANNDTSKK